jgi:2,4-dienoyl-CoA reductase-like NADH-dependent reductase (Old Yellow Enzyme family)
MSALFESTIINGMILANRFVRSATWEGLATTDGACTSRLSDMMVKLVEGGVGLIITGHGYVSREGQASPWQLGIHEHIGSRERPHAVAEAGTPPVNPDTRL